MREIADVGLSDIQQRLVQHQKSIRRDTADERRAQLLRVCLLAVAGIGVEDVEARPQSRCYASERWAASVGGNPGPLPGVHLEKDVRRRRGLRAEGALGTKSKGRRRIGGLVTGERVDGSRQGDRLYHLFGDNGHVSEYAGHIDFIGHWIHGDRNDLDSSVDCAGGISGPVNHRHIVAIEVAHINLVRHRIHSNRSGIHSNANRGGNVQGVDHRHFVAAAVGHVDLICQWVNRDRNWAGSGGDSFGERDRGVEDHRDVVAAIIGHIDLARYRVHCNRNRASSHAHCRGRVGDAVDHRHVIAEVVGDVYLVRKRVHGHR